MSKSNLKQKFVQGLKALRLPKISSRHIFVSPISLSYRNLSGGSVKSLKPGEGLELNFSGPAEAHLFVTRNKNGRAVGPIYMGAIKANRLTVKRVMAGQDAGNWHEVWTAIIGKQSLTVASVSYAVVAPAPTINRVAVQAAPLVMNDSTKVLISSLEQQIRTLEHRLGQVKGKVKATEKVKVKDLEKQIAEIHGILDHLKQGVVMAKASEINILPAASPAGNKYKTTHVIKKGETLWALAKKYYGQGTKWRKILEANTKVIKNPKVLNAGTELKIPVLAVKAKK